MTKLQALFALAVALAATGVGGIVLLFSLYGWSAGYNVGSGLWHLLQFGPRPVLDNQPLGDWPNHRVSWLGDLPELELNESSGLTASQIHPDILWSINDSGSDPLIYAFDTTGQPKGTWRVDTQRNVDWESMDSFTHEGQAYLVIGDTGDNFRWRPHLHVLVVREPSELSGPQGPLRVEWELKYKYPTGYRDSEALAVDVASNAIYVLSKRHYPPELYKLPLLPISGNDSGSVVDATLLAELSGFPKPTVLEHEMSDDARYTHMPSGMDLAGTRLLITTYKHAYVFDLTKLGALPERVTLPTIGQREAISFAHERDDRAFVTKERYEGVGVADLYLIELDP